MSNLDINVNVNLQVNLHVNLNVNCNICQTMVTNMTLARMDVTSQRNAICPNPAFGRWGHKKTSFISMFHTLGKNFSRQHFEIYFYLFFPENRFDISYKLFAHFKGTGYI